MSRRLASVPAQDGAVICLTAQEARDAASMIGVAVHANQTIADLAVRLERFGTVLGVPVRLPERRLIPSETRETVLKLAARMYEAAGDPQGVTAALLSRASTVQTAENGAGGSEPAPGLFDATTDETREPTRAQEHAAQAMSRKHGRSSVAMLSDGSVVVSGIGPEDEELETVCVERDGTVRWRIPS